MPVKFGPAGNSESFYASGKRVRFKRRNGSKISDLMHMNIKAVRVYAAAVKLLRRLERKPKNTE